MTKDEINRKLAIDVMGWVIKSTFYNYPREGLIEEYHESNRLGIPIINVSRWNPRENIEQAFEVLEKFDAWECRKHPLGMSFACLVFDGKNSCVSFEKTLEEAICNAAISAIKED